MSDTVVGQNISSATQGRTRNNWLIQIDRTDNNITNQQSRVSRFNTEDERKKLA
jgi:hypothetical protein